MTTTTRWIAAGMLALGLAGTRLPLRADTYPRQTGLKITHYAFNVTLGDDSDAVTVTDAVTGEFLAAGVRSIDLDLCGVRAPAAPNAAPATGDPCVGRQGAALSGTANATAIPPGMTVTAVTAADGSPLTFTHQNDRLHIDFPQPSQVGGTFAFTVSYHGVPATGLRIGPNKYQDREFFSNDWPDLARNWLATIDHPSMKAAKTMTVIAPRKYQVISNGKLTESTDLPNDLRRTTWDEAVPICAWQYSLGVAPMAVSYFGEFHGIPLSAWVYPQERDAAFKGFSDYTQPILEFYIDHIGPYSYEKLGQVEANGVSGGMELASSIFYSFATTGPSRQLLAHEIAHQWFGDSATEKDWDDVWLSEGFATYFALLYQEHQDGREAFVNGVKSSASQAVRYALAHPDSPLVHNNLSNVSQVIANNAQIYQGGAQVLHMLRGVLGDETFWSGIRLYYSRFRNSNANDADLQKAMEDASGQDLSWFFPEWLHRGGVLEAKGSWHYDPGAKLLHIEVDQTQTGGLYRMPIQIGIIMPPPPPPPPPSAADAAGGGAGGAGRGAGRGGRGAGRGGRGAAAAASIPVILVDKAHNTLDIPLAAAPADVQLDPNTWVTMMQAQFVKN